MIRRLLGSSITAQVRSYSVTAKLGFRILATDGVDEKCIEIFKQRGHDVDISKSLAEDELIKIIGNYHGLVVRSATKVTPNVLKHATNMKIIGRAGVGYDNINVAEATKCGVMVMNTPGGNTVSTAQLTVSLLCALARKIPAADMTIKEGKWDRKSFMGVELHSKTLGIIGCGRIGQVVASCAKSMGMNVIGYDPVMSLEGFADAGIKRADLDTIWAKSDFITVHTPLTPETANIVNDASLAKCKKGVQLINCARGGIIDEAALLRGLESGQVAGAALDVYTSEPPKEHLRPLLGHKNVICTPHLGASTEEAQINVSRDVAIQMCDVFDGVDFTGVVNVPYIAASTRPHMKPFMSLAESIGNMQAQLGDTTARITSVVLKTWGGRDENIATKSARQLLQAMVLKGITKNLGRPSGLISAPFAAKDLGIEAVISSDFPENVGGPYWNVLSVEVHRSDGSVRTVSGSVFGNQPHIVQVDDFKDIFAFKPEGNHILSFRNEDRPGAISEVLGVLLRANVNVASVTVARADGLVGESGKPLKPALCFMALDDNVDERALNELKGLSALKSVSIIHQV